MHNNDVTGSREFAVGRPNFSDLTPSQMTPNQKRATQGHRADGADTKQNQPATESVFAEASTRLAGTSPEATDSKLAKFKDVLANGSSTQAQNLIIDKTLGNDKFGAALSTERDDKVSTTAMLAWSNLKPTQFDQVLDKALETNDELALSRLAWRDDLSEPQFDALVATGDENVLANLNNRSDVTPDRLAKLPLAPAA